MKNIKLSSKTLKEMYNLLVSNLKLTFPNIIIKKEDYYIWSNNVLNNPRLNTYYLEDDKEVYAYIQWINNCICEIQIDKKRQSDGKTLYYLLSVFLKNTYFNKDDIYVNINKENEKSLAVFTHIGFKNIKENKYAIKRKDLIKYLKNKDI